MPSMQPQSQPGVRGAPETQPKASGVQDYCLFDTALGVCGVAWNQHGLTRLQLPESDRAATVRRLRVGAATSVTDPPPPIKQVIAALQQYFAGEKVDFSSVALDLTGVGPFHRKVYDAARALGWGHTTTYGELAQRTGDPAAARAVGQALAQNPVPIIIPCHRILASGGKVGGFSAYGGATAKLRLLALEGIHVGDDAPRLPGL
jgi:methylated-DNA-[protein]-cysteine S-methyltransferase